MNTELSVIIPTCQRNESLARLLASLERQTLPCDAFEVIVIIDGNAPHTAEFLKNYKGALRLRFHGVPPSGAGCARNQGAEMANGRILVFLDDDMEAQSGLLAAHLLAACAGESVGVGNLVTLLPKRAGFLGSGLRIWWERKFEEMRRDGHRFSYVDLLSGHFSIPARTFAKIGGFDPALNCREDYELGIRLIQAQIRFGFVQEATAIHHETENLRKSLDRVMKEGFADVWLARRYPELARSLAAALLCQTDLKPFGKRRLIEHVVRNRPRLAEQLLTRIEHLGMRGLWQRGYMFLRKFWYMQGVCSACPDAKERKMIFSPPANLRKKTVGIIDLQNGMAQAALELEKIRPEFARLFHGNQAIGTIPPEPFADNIGARHLAPYVREHCGHVFLKAIALDRVTQYAPVKR
jgi:GT2 family glycosyltransferase